MGFAKVDASILDSSIWAEDLATKVLWITMLVMADAGGYVAASAGGLFRRAGVTEEQGRRALGVLSGPDPDSRDGTSGERIRQAERGWFIINHAVYRNLRDEEARREYERERKRKQRSRFVPDTSGTSGDSPSLSAMSAHAEAEAEAAAEAAAGTEAVASLPASRSTGVLDEKGEGSSTPVPNPELARMAKSQLQRLSDKFSLRGGRR